MPQALKSFEFQALWATVARLSRLCAASANCIVAEGISLSKKICHWSGKWDRTLPRWQSRICGADAFISCQPWNISIWSPGFSLVSAYMHSARVSSQDPGTNPPQDLHNYVTTVCVSGKAANPAYERYCQALSNELDIRPLSTYKQAWLNMLNADFFSEEIWYKWIWWASAMVTINVNYFSAWFGSSDGQKCNSAIFLESAMECQVYSTYCMS